MRLIEDEALITVEMHSCLNHFYHSPNIAQHKRAKINNNFRAFIRTFFVFIILNHVACASTLHSKRDGMCQFWKLKRIFQPRCYTRKHCLIVRFMDFIFRFGRIVGRLVLTTVAKKLSIARFNNSCCFLHFNCSVYQSTKEYH